jgi:hypothetical protein
MTAIEYLEENLISEPYSENEFKHNKECWNKAESLEKVKEAKRLLFIGKVSQVIGFDKTAELLKEVEKEIKKGI